MRGRRASSWIGILIIGLAPWLAAAQPSASPAEADPRPLLAADDGELAAVPIEELRLRLLPQRREVIQEAAFGWLQRLATAAERLSSLALATPNGATEEIDAARRRVEALAERTAVVLDALEAKGGDVTEPRLYVSSVNRLAERIAGAAAAARAAEAGPAGPPSLEERIAAEVLRVQNERPAHERDEPWAVPTSELINELQPLRREQIEERLDLWLGLLQDQVRQRNRLQIAAEQADDPELREALFTLAADINTRVTAIIARLEVLMETIRRRGGDIGDARRYVTNVTGVRLNLTDPAVLQAQLIAWLRSPDGGLAVGLRLLTFAMIIAVAWVLSRVAGRLVQAALKRSKRASGLLRDFLAGGVQRLVMLIGLVVAVSRLGIDITPLVAAIGAAGLVIGLALQGTLSNFASGILILFYRPYDVGDVIDGGGTSGKVEAMNLVSTRIATFDNKVIVVPNNQIWNGVITNYTTRPTRRVDLEFGISYTADIGVAETAIREVIAAHPKTLDDPPPLIKVGSLGDSSVNLLVRPWALSSDYWDVYWDLNRLIKEKLDAVGVIIPYPQRDLYLPEGIEVSLKRDDR